MFPTFLSPLFNPPKLRHIVAHLLSCHVLPGLTAFNSFWAKQAFFFCERRKRKEGNINQLPILPETLEKTYNGQTIKAKPRSEEGGSSALAC